MRSAADDDAAGLIAVVDGDGQGRDRLQRLRAARDSYRERNPSFPTALGCAEPHLEAWLLDDERAVRTVLE